MTPSHSIERHLGLLLLIGTMISTMIILIGGIAYLWQFGSDNVEFELFQNIPKSISMREIWLEAMTFTPLGIVQFGLLLLVGTQLLRVVLLLGYYIQIRDFWFSLICGFVLLVLIYSFL